MSHLSATSIVSQLIKTGQNQELHNNGIYIIPTSNNTIWNCILFIREGYYRKGKFKVKLYTPEGSAGYDLRVYFQTQVYHPLIDYNTGELDLRRFDRTSEDCIGALLLFVKNIFVDQDYLSISNSFNVEAGEKFLQDPSYFNEKVKVTVEQTKENLLSDQKFTTERDQRNTQDIRELVENIVKCTGNIDDKVSVLVDNILSILPENSEE